MRNYSNNNDHLHNDGGKTISFQQSFIFKSLRSSIHTSNRLCKPDEECTDPVSDSKIEYNGNGKISVELLPRSSSGTENIRNFNENVRAWSYRNYSRTNTVSSTRDEESNASTLHFRKVQRSSSGVLIGIVLIFLICNFPRFIVKTFIISSHGKGLEEQFLYCDSLNQLHVPVFVHIIGKISLMDITL